MRVFVTGSTGFIGSAIVEELRTAGHDVLGLARNDAAAERLESIGVTVHRGDLADLERLAAGARTCDGVIHTAFIHDFSRYMDAAETDRRAIAAMTGALEGSGKPFVSTSGTALLEEGRVVTEDDAPAPRSAGAPRAAAEAEVLAAAGRGVRASIVRLPATVHGSGDHAFVPALIGIAQATGFAAYVGEGANRWPAVHRLDAARLFRLALEKADFGARLHAVAEEGIPIRSIAGTISERLGLPARSVTADEASAHFGWLARFVAIDNPASSAGTRSALGWCPEQPDLLTDMHENGYFESGVPGGAASD